MAAECRSLTRRRLHEGGCLWLDDRCVIGLSGAGPEAAECGAVRLAEEGATALISWGCAAALAPELKPGDLVLPSTIIGTDGVHLDATGDWRERLVSSLEGKMPVNQGALAESARIVATTAEKEAIFAATGAIALDMESAAAARVARTAHLPFLAIRSIVDPAHVSIPPSILGAFDENGMLRVAKMLGRTILHPRDFADVVRLGKHFSAAMTTLRQTAAATRQTYFATQSPR